MIVFEERSHELCVPHLVTLCASERTHGVAPFAPLEHVVHEPHCQTNAHFTERLIACMVIICCGLNYGINYGGVQVF